MLSSQTGTRLVLHVGQLSFSFPFAILFNMLSRLLSFLILIIPYRSFLVMSFSLILWTHLFPFKIVRTLGSLYCPPFFFPLWGFLEEIIRDLTLPPYIFFRNPLSTARTPSRDSCLEGFSRILPIAKVGIYQEIAIRLRGPVSFLPPQNSLLPRFCPISLTPSLLTLACLEGVYMGSQWDQQ